MVTRGCGTRVAGGAYIVCPLAKEGVPIERTLIDPPIEITEEMGLSPIGMKYMPPTETRPYGLLLDWVGSKHYPNVADFVEEVRRFGMSRRISASFDFSQIAPGTKHVLVHSRAVIENSADYWAAEGSHHDCPKGASQDSASQAVATEHNADDYQAMCAQLWYQDLEGGTATLGNRYVEREMPGGFSYCGNKRPDGVTPKYIAGMFMALPVVRIEVVAAGDGSHDKVTKRAEKAGVRVKVVSE
jgi:hypothetical protein